MLPKLILPINQISWQPWQKCSNLIFLKPCRFFESVLNSKSGDNSYKEEAEYYISLAYLMNHQENKAIQMLDKIKADPNHTYYPMVSKISGIDLKIIELKNK